MTKHMTEEIAIITGDETWVYEYVTESRRQASEYSAANETKLKINTDSVIRNFQRILTLLPIYHVDNSKANISLKNRSNKKQEIWYSYNSREINKSICRA